MLQTRLKTIILIVKGPPRRHILLTGYCSFGMTYASNCSVARAQQTIYAIRWRSSAALPAINNLEPLQASCKPEGLCKRGTAAGSLPENAVM